MANSKIPNINLSDTLNTQRLRFNQLLDSVGDVSTLTTTEKNITEAINEHDAELGVIDAYVMGTASGTVSGAISELDGRLDSINDTQLSTPKIYVSDSNAINHIKGTVNIDTDLNVVGSVDIDTNLSVHGNLVVDGTTAISAGADGNINLGDGLQDSDTVIFNAEIGSHIVPGTDDQHDIGSGSKEFRHGYFDGTVNADELAADSATIGTLKVTDLTNNRVTIAGTGGELEDDANFTFNGTALSVGNTTIDKGATGINTTGLEADSATITANADITGNLDVGGNFTVDGNVDLGNASADTVSINGQVDTNIVPSTNNARSLGSNSNQWKHLHVTGTGYIDEVSADSATIGTLKVTDLTDGRIVIVGSNDEIADDADLTYSTSTNTLAVPKIDVGTSAELASAKVEDLTNNRIVIAGTGGELEDDGNLTYDGKTFNVGQGEFTVDSLGAVYITKDLYVNDSADIRTNLRVGQDLVVKGDFEVNGLFTTTGQTRIAGAEIVLNSGIAIDGANRPGIAIDRDTADSAVLRWNEQSDYWEVGYIHTGADSFWKIAIDNHNADFADITATDISSTGDLSAAGNLNVDGLTTLDSTTVNGDMEVTGNFTVTGTTTYINTETVTIDDNIIVLNDNATGVPAAGQDAGIEIERGSRTNVQLLWDEDQGYWVSATDSSNTLSRIATANWIDATAPISFNSSTGKITHDNSTVSAGTYGSVTVDAKGHVTGGTNPTYDNYVRWVAQDSAGTNYFITSGDTLTIKGDGFIKSDFTADDVLTIYHSKVGAASQNNSGGTFIQDVTMDSYGHVTAMGTGSVSNDTITISPRNGLKTGGNFTLNGSATTVYIDIDSAELRDDFIEKLVYDQITLNSPPSDYQGNLRSTDGTFRLSDDTSNTTSRPVYLGLMNTDTTLSDAALLGEIDFEGENSTGTRTAYASVSGSARDVSNATEDGEIKIGVKSGGNAFTVFQAQGNSTTDIQSASLMNFRATEYGGDSAVEFRFQGATDGAANRPAHIGLYNNNTSITDNDSLGALIFQGRNSFSLLRDYASIETRAKDVTHTTEDGFFEIKVKKAGTYNTILSYNPDLTLYSNEDIYIRPNTDEIYFQSVTTNEQIHMNLGNNSQSLTSSDDFTITSGDDLFLTASTDVYLRPTGDDVYMQGTTSGEQLQFNLGASKQTITSSDQMDLTSASSILFTTTSSVGTVSSELEGGTFTLETEPYNASYPYNHANFNIRHPRMNAATDGKIGVIHFKAPDHLLGDADKSYGRIEGWDTQTAYPDEAGRMVFYVQKSLGDMKFLEADGEDQTTTILADTGLILRSGSGLIDLYHGGSQDVRFDVATTDTLKIYTGLSTLNSTFSGDDLTVQGDITSISDVRTKENIETITDGLEIVDSLRGVRYNKIGKEDRKVGVIAQEVEEVLPEVINTDDEGMKSVDYGKMVGVLIEAIKDLKSEIDMLKLKLGE